MNENNVNEETLQEVLKQVKRLNAWISFFVWSSVILVVVGAIGGFFAFDAIMNKVQSGSGQGGASITELLQGTNLSGQ